MRGKRSVRAVVSFLTFVFAAGTGHAATFDELAASAAAARRSNQLAEAIGLYRQAVDLKADWAEGWWFVGTLSYSLNRYQDCETAFQKFVRLDGSRVPGWALLGLCEFETGNYDGARTDLARALVPGSDLSKDLEPVARFHYGMLLTKAGLFDQGRRQFEPYVRGGSPEPMLVVAMGINGLRRPWLPEDIPADQQDLILKAGKAACAWVTRDTTAQDTFRELLNSYPAAPGVHLLYGMYLSAQPEEAQAEMRRELEVDPHSAAAHAMLALSLMPGDMAGALEHAKKAAEKTADPLVDYALGKALVETGALAEGIARLEAAERTDPETLMYHMTLAGAYSKAGRVADAGRERRESIAMARGANAN